MAVAKNPGTGQGRGGGRPRREGAVEMVHLRLTPEAADMLRAIAEVQGIPAWQVVERLVLDGPPAWPPEITAIATEAVAFLEAAEDRSAALRALRRSWKQTLILARHGLQEKAGPEE